MVMLRSSTPAATGIVLVVAALAVAMVVILSGGGRAVGDEPGTSPSASPSGVPASPSADPSLPTGTFDVDLDVATPHDVSVVVSDRTGSIVAARTGRAGDGMSVRWYETLVENQDADTLRVTWVGFPQDEVVRLDVHGSGVGLRLRLVAAGPPPNSDGLGYDRVLYLDLGHPVRSEGVQASIEPSLDAAG